ncbi:MAG: AtpZ/AtpI family protein [Neomegalonema sp.]|nr:AtpZ/AtpI family protein [Neomegalonema sp.]
MTEKRDGESELQARIRRARDDLEPKRTTNAAEKYNALTIAWRMTLELVVGTGLGAAIGWSLDELFSSKPLFLIGFGILGFAAGVRTVMATAQEMSRRNSSDTDKSDADAKDQ